MIRTIRLPALERSVTVKAYVAAVRLAKENPESTFKHGLSTWWPTTGADIMRQFNQGRQERINQAVPYRLRGTQP